MKKILMMAVVAVFAAGSAQAAKKPPKHCEKKNERFANPFGSVLIVRDEAAPSTVKESGPGVPKLDDKIIGSKETPVGKNQVAALPQYRSCLKG